MEWGGAEWKCWWCRGWGGMRSGVRVSLMLVGSVMDHAHQLTLYRGIWVGKAIWVGNMHWVG